jgi:hypothetical protein
MVTPSLKLIDGCQTFDLFSIATASEMVRPEARMKNRKIELLTLAVLFMSAGCGTPSASKNVNGNAMLAHETATNTNESHTSIESQNTNEPTNPNATFKGCWYKQGTHRYQGVDISVGNAGKYAFNAVLYHGTTCNPKDFADQIGFGEELNFGGFGYTFWFTHFPNQKSTSAIWYVGPDNSKCVSYEDAPNC